MKFFLSKNIKNLKRGKIFYLILIHRAVDQTALQLPWRQYKSH